MITLSRFLTFFAGLAIALLMPHGAACANDGIDAAKQVEYFEKHVRPIFVNHCYSCHSADTKPAGMLRVDVRSGVITGGNSGPAVVPGHPEKSLLINRVAHDAKKRMPQDLDPLSEEQIEILKTWIKHGAHWPPISVKHESDGYEDYYASLRSEHWAFQPVNVPDVPTVQHQKWTRTPIDQFILSRLKTEGLAPVVDSDKRTLIRRITFDLTGLPPTPDEITDFLNDSDEKAYERVVDRLLDSPRFGEHWGRHWLDVARYGESTGPSRNVPYPHAWKYRDYIIDAVNRDVPFNQFVREQLAGDLLPAETNDERNRLSIATGYLALGVKDVNQRFKARFLMDNVDEQIDVVTRSVLGLTVSCARCHDHKFDPIPTADYYALAGIFTSTENAAGLRNQMGGGGLAYYVPDLLVRLRGEFEVDPVAKVELEEKVEKAKAEFEAIRGTEAGLKKGKNGRPIQRQYRQKWDRLKAKLLALSDPAQHGLAAHGVRDASSPAGTAIRIRGEEELHGPVVPRGFLMAFEVPNSPTVNPNQSGRLELAEWLTSPQNPLISRVIVNRVWYHLFGRGIVSTVDNFGTTGAPPSHPELLDFLANRFVEEGWSVKRLVRSLVLSRTYQLSSEATDVQLARDPENVLLWRHTPRRLTAEEIRDAVLLTTGQLSLNRPSSATVEQFPMMEIRDNGKEAKSIYATAAELKARSIYLPQLRGLVPASLAAFDPVEQTLVSGQRDTTTVPGQVLFLLNAPFIRNHTIRFAEVLAAQTETTDAERISQVYHAILNREPSNGEREAGLTFIESYKTTWHLPSQAAQNSSTSEASTEVVITKIDAAVQDDEEQPDVFVEGILLPRSQEEAAWAAFAQAMIATAEFRYIR